MLFDTPTASGYNNLVKPRVELVVREAGATPTATQMLIEESTKVASIYRGFDSLLNKAVEHVKATGFLPVDPEMDELVDKVVNQAILKEEKKPLTRRV